MSRTPVSLYFSSTAFILDSYSSLEAFLPIHTFSMGSPTASPCISRRVFSHRACLPCRSLWSPWSRVPQPHSFRSSCFHEASWRCPSLRSMREGRGVVVSVVPRRSSWLLRQGLHVGSKARVAPQKVHA